MLEYAPHGQIAAVGRRSGLLPSASLSLSSRDSARATCRMTLRWCVNNSLPLSPRESSKSVSSGSTAGHWGVSSGPPVRVRTGRESGLSWRGQWKCAEFRAETAAAANGSREGCVKRQRAGVLPSQRSGSPSWVRTGDPLVNGRVPIGPTTAVQIPKKLPGARDRSWMGPRDRADTYSTWSRRCRRRDLGSTLHDLIGRGPDRGPRAQRSCTHRLPSLRRSARLVGLDESVALKQTMCVRMAHEPAEAHSREVDDLGLRHRGRNLRRRTPFEPLMRPLRVRVASVLVRGRTEGSRSPSHCRGRGLPL